MVAIGIIRVDTSNLIVQYMREEWRLFDNCLPNIICIGSYLLELGENVTEVWCFEHPTFSRVFKL